VERAEQPHAVTGAEIARKYNENLTVQQAILHHHEEPSIANPISVLVHTANIISKERPGAHLQAFETYVQRLHDLEAIAMAIPGVTQAYAIQAGRELRILVDFNIIDDNKVIQLADDIAHKIETDMTYAGQIKITVIREYRAMDMAK
jgi:ribonucrease Y